MNIKDLTPEQMEKAKACKDASELIALATAEGIELSDQELDGLAGAGGWSCSAQNCGAPFHS